MEVTNKIGQFMIWEFSLVLNF